MKLEGRTDGDEGESRRVEAERLCDQMDRYGAREEALEALEAAVRIAESRSDLPLAKQIAARVVQQIPTFLYITPDHYDRHLEAQVEILDEGEAHLPDPEDVGASDQFLSRFERAADAFADLADCLDAEDDERAIELRAGLLLGELDAVGKLGNSEKMEALSERFASLGDAAVAACNSRIEIAEKALRDHRSYAINAVVGSLMMKAGLLWQNDEDDSALVVFTEIIDRFGDSDEPVVAATVRMAREMQLDLLE